MMACRGIYIFSHECPYGNAPAQTLLERIIPKLNDGVESPRVFSNYKVAVQDANLPDGVTLTRLVG
jgi:CRISPR-associated protein Csd2